LIKRAHGADGADLCNPSRPSSSRWRGASTMGRSGRYPGRPRHACR
jgi:hypothetical protein